MDTITWLAIFIPIVLFIISAIVGYKLCSRKLKKSVKEKPLFNRKQIKAIFQTMGVQISEQNINQMMNSMTKNLEEGAK
jgi:uncharacterized protein YneF (UPF0154 family)